MKKSKCHYCTQPWKVNYSSPESPVNPPFKSFPDFLESKDEIIMSYLTTEDLIAELKKRGLGVFNLSLPFNFRPNEEIQIHRSSKTKKKTGGDI